MKSKRSSKQDQKRQSKKFNTAPLFEAQDLHTLEFEQAEKLKKIENVEKI